MLNFDLRDLRLVNPKKDWLNKDARSLAADADQVLEHARVYPTTKEALHDLQLVYATTARPRELNKAVLTPRQAAAEIEVQLKENQKIGLLFGSEKCGLDNEDIALACKIITIPLNPSFTSINLSHALMVISYEIYQAHEDMPAGNPLWERQDEVAPYEDLIGLFNHLEEELEKSGYFRVKHKKAVMARTLRNLLTRAQLSTQEVRTLRGVITSLVNPQGIYSRQGRRKNLNLEETN